MSVINCGCAFAMSRRSKSYVTRSPHLPRQVVVAVDDGRLLQHGIDARTSSLRREGRLRRDVSERTRDDQTGARQPGAGGDGHGTTRHDESR